MLYLPPGAAELACRCCHDLRYASENMTRRSRLESFLCPVCAGRADPIPGATLRSDPFWLLTPQEIERVEAELIRLAAEAERLDRTSEALAEEYGDGSDEYEAEAAEYWAVERERLLLHMLHAASRQFGSR